MVNTGHTTTTREKNMNTIQITNDEGQVINYTEAEIKNAFKLHEANKALAVAAQDQLRKVRNEVRDFFSEGEWDSGEQTINKGDVNFLLERIGTNKLTSKYTGSGTIEFTFELEAEDEDEARTIVEDNVSLQYSWVDILDENINVDDVSEYE